MNFMVDAGECMKLNKMEYLTQTFAAQNINGIIGKGWELAPSD
jgi:hypothetical protein